MKTIVLLLLLLLSGSLSSQTLFNHPDINLNTGARVYDVKHIPGLNAYVIVGDFSTINGQQRRKIALIDDVTFELKNNPPFNNSLDFDGAIRSVEYKKVGNTNYLVVGGDFFSINGDPKQAMALFTITGNLTPTSVFQLYNWNYALTDFHGDIGAGTYGKGVFDLNFIGDTLYIGGNIMGIDLTDGTSGYLPPAVYGYCFFALKATPETSSKFSIVSSSITNNGISGDVYSGQWKGVLSVEKIENNLFIGGGGYAAFNPPYIFEKRGLDFTIDNTFNPEFYLRHQQSSIEKLNDSVIVATVGHSPSKETMMFYRKEGYAYGGNSNYATSNSDFGADVVGYKTHNSDLFVVKNNSPQTTLKRYQLNGSTFVGPVEYLNFSEVGNEVQITPYLNGNQTIDTLNNLFIQNNKLFISARGITSVDGTPRLGLAIFCIEPKDPKPFVDFETQVCAGNEIVYSIPSSDGAKGYRWSYTGNGAMYRITGSSLPFAPLSDVHIAIDTAYSLEIQFNQNVTEGMLSVIPYSVCNTSTDYLYAKPQSLNLSLIPPPTIYMQDSLRFTCIVDTLNLVVGTDEPSASFYWRISMSDQNIGTDDTLQIDKNSADGYYYGFVEEPIKGCTSMDSIFISFDTIAVSVDQSNIIQSPSLFDCFSDSVIMDLNVSNAHVQWGLPGDTTRMESPLVLYSTDTLSLIAYYTYYSNGCTAQTEAVVQVDNSIVPGIVNGNGLNVLIFDTLSCNTTSLNLLCEVEPGYSGSAHWVINGIPSGNELILTHADTVGMPSSNTQTYLFRTINDSSGCTQDYNVAILFDISHPFVSQMGNRALNCSQSELTIIHPKTGGADIIEGWLDAGNNQTGDSILLVNNVGTYYYQVHNASNGCTAIDTVEVIQSNELLLNLTSDTLICNGQTIPLMISNINNSEPTIYNWSNGATGTTINATGGLTSQLTVIGQNQSGCIGYDTIQIAIPEPVQVEFILTSTCVEAAIQISNISGGTGNYQYAIDGGTWQTNTFFGDLSFGSHQIAVLDDLGCIYNFTQVVDGSGESPDINFLVSTYNLEGDTLAIVNISNYTGFDSLVWELPTGATIHSLDDSMIVVSITSGGWYNVTLKAYIDTCSYSFSKPVFFGTEKPNFDISYSETGIKNLSIYPNPTTGQFIVSFELGINQNYSIAVTNLQGQPVSGMQVSGTGTEIEHTLSFPLGSAKGNYRIHIVSDFDAKQASILLVD